MWKVYNYEIRVTYLRIIKVVDSASKIPYKVVYFLQLRRIYCIFANRNKISIKLFINIKI